MSNLTTILTQVITNLYVSTGLLGIALAMAIESCCIPLPSEIVMPLAGIMIASGKILHGINTPVALVLVALAGSAGCLIGSTVAYWIGYAGGRPLMLKYGRYVLISQHDADKADAFFRRWGSATAFFSRLLPVVRTYISLPAGISKMPFARFCTYTFLGSFPWSLGLAYAGFILGNHLDTLGPIFHDLDVVILLAFVALVILYVWRHVRNDRKARAAHANDTYNAQPVPSSNPAQSWSQQPRQVGQPGQAGMPQQWGQPPMNASMPGFQQFSAPPQGWGQPAVPQSPQPPAQFMPQQQAGQWSGQPPQQFVPQQQAPQRLSQFGPPPFQEQGQPQWSQWGQMPQQVPAQQQQGPQYPYSLYPQAPQSQPPQQPQQGWGQPTQPPQR